MALDPAGSALGVGGVGGGGGVNMPMVPSYILARNYFSTKYVWIKPCVL